MSTIEADIFLNYIDNWNILADIFIKLGVIGSIQNIGIKSIIGNKHKFVGKFFIFVLFWSKESCLKYCFEVEKVV